MLTAGKLLEVKAHQEDFDYLLKSAVPCGCKKPLLGFWRDGQEWQPRCRLCNKRFRVVEVSGE